MLSLTAPLKSKVRLWIEYFLIMVVVVLAGMVAWNKFQNLRLERSVEKLSGQVATQQQRIAQAEQVNKEQAKAIATIDKMRELDSYMLKGLDAALSVVQARDKDVRTRIATLEKSNEAVRLYLDGAVPDPLACVLDKTCLDEGEADRAGAAGPSARPLPRPLPRTQPDDAKHRRK